MIILYILVVIVIAVYFFMRQSSFGKIATGERLKKMQQSSNYRDGSFQNIHLTPTLTGGKNYVQVLWEFFLHKSKRLRPAETLPSEKTNLYTLSPDKNVLVWFGHSSYFIQADGKKILVDPVFSGNASPVSFTTKSYAGTDVYSVDDIPPLDYLIISHDHWDHLDYPTILALKTKVKTVITGLGTGAHLERWGYDPEKIFEKDWNETIDLTDGFIIHTLPARHFSGRGFKRNQVLWMSFAFITPTLKLYLGGDSGYDTHFKEIGITYGPFDLAILECGQYNENWKHIHMMPEETVQAAIDLRAKKLLPVHWAKFSLGQHAWDEPIIRVSKESAAKHMPLLHPMIGEAVDLDDDGQVFEEWWGGEL